MTVGIRDAQDAQEHQQTGDDRIVLGGRDYAQRPEFYLPYDAAYTPAPRPAPGPCQPSSSSFQQPPAL
ncbi:MAG: hypothetical protein U1E75_09135 [Alicycliphilus sp.]